jgi:hypothetical protein
LEGEEDVQPHHLSEAIHYRSLDRESWGAWVMIINDWVANSLQRGTIRPKNWDSWRERKNRTVEFADTEYNKPLCGWYFNFFNNVILNH